MTGLHIRFSFCLNVIVLACPWLAPAAEAEKLKAPLIKLPVNFGAAMENTPVVFGDRPLLCAQLPR